MTLQDDPLIKLFVQLVWWNDFDVSQKYMYEAHVTAVNYMYGGSGQCVNYTAGVLVVRRGLGLDRLIGCCSAARCIRDSDRVTRTFRFYVGCTPMGSWSLCWMRARCAATEMHT